MRKLILCTLLTATLPGCNALPTSGPYHYDIADGAAASLLSERNTVAFNYALLDINRLVLEHVAEIGPGSLFKTFGKGHGPAPVIRIGVGDIVQVAIFESSSGGLFIPPEAGVRPGNFVTLPVQEVDRAGNITVPYAGQVQAVGRTLQEVQSDIESRLLKRAIEPQVVVTFIERNASEVTVVGEVVTVANRFKIRPGGERILDMISKAAGLKYPGYELFVTLQRGRQRATVYFPTLINNPEENIFVTPGDTIYVYREQQKFVAIGALGTVGQTSGLTGQFAFEQERLSLNEAVAKAGGLLDFRANPGQVFLYRLEHREVLERLKVDLRAFPPEQVMIPVVYRANFRDPSSFFFAQSFPMRHKDVIYVSNADSVEVTKFLAYLLQYSSTTSGIGADIVLSRDSILLRR
ncbi:MAG TPA: polysaccharide biosynthesis/export family protein [Hyphomicrobiaceae bacterium]|jgi:polysaccharide export outer membrane protein|nr:polysaccharide biosynthesis/export family protein [Hyphomicrobiaceae bacterium]